MKENYIKIFKGQEGTNFFELFDSLLYISKIIQINKGNYIIVSTKKTFFLSNESFWQKNKLSNKNNQFIFRKLKTYLCPKENDDILNK